MDGDGYSNTSLTQMGFQPLHNFDEISCDAFSWPGANGTTV